MLSRMVILTYLLCLSGCIFGMSADDIAERTIQNIQTISSYKVEVRVETYLDVNALGASKDGTVITSAKGQVDRINRLLSVSGAIISENSTVPTHTVMRGSQLSVKTTAGWTEEDAIWQEQDYLSQVATLLSQSPVKVTDESIDETYYVLEVLPDPQKLGNERSVTYYRSTFFIRKETFEIDEVRTRMQHMLSGENSVRSRTDINLIFSDFNEPGDI